MCLQAKYTVNTNHFYEELVYTECINVSDNYVQLPYC